MNDTNDAICEYIETPNGGFIECARRFIIDNEQKALEIVACCGEHETNKLLVHSDSLPSEFYNLRTGLAGSVLLKFSNYRIILAAVITPKRIGTGHFYEMVLETNRGHEFRVFTNRDEAATWLSNL